MLCQVQCRKAYRHVVGQLTIYCDLSDTPNEDGEILGEWKQVERDNFGRRVDAEMLVCEYIEHFCPDPRPYLAAARNHQDRNGLLKSGRWKALLKRPRDALSTTNS